MLTLITGHVQSGKTTKLLSLCEEFERHGREVFGIVSPGIFDEKGKKIAVKGELFPTHEILQLGTKNSQGWKFEEHAIEKINAHFAFLSHTPDVFVVDEIGPLELNSASGFSVALAMLRVGPQVCGNDAYVVVRQKLTDVLLDQVAGAWDEMNVIEA
jgi:nucleoside-triphosphatase THEP1